MVLRRLAPLARRALSTECPPLHKRIEAAAASGNIAEVRRLLRVEDCNPTTASAVWEDIQKEAEAQLAVVDPNLSMFGVDRFIRRSVLDHDTLAAGIAHNVGGKLAANSAEANVNFEMVIQSCLEADPEITESVAHDLQRFRVVDPAAKGLLGVYLFYKGVQALACARVSHHFWTERGGHGQLVARMLQSEMADVYGVDIHPGCKLGRGITIDHATGVVLGETCVIGDRVYLMHDVTLGATGTSDDFDRHPKVGNDVFLGAKCTVLGNIQVGDGATVAAGALVNKPVPAGHTAVGVPARLIAPKPEKVQDAEDFKRKAK